MTHPLVSGLISALGQLATDRQAGRQALTEMGNELDADDAAAVWRTSGPTVIGGGDRPNDIAIVTGQQRVTGVGSVLRLMTTAIPWVKQVA